MIRVYCEPSLAAVATCFRPFASAFRSFAEPSSRSIASASVSAEDPSNQPGPDATANTSHATTSEKEPTDLLSRPAVKRVFRLHHILPEKSRSGYLETVAKQNAEGLAERRGKNINGLKVKLPPREAAWVLSKADTMVIDNLVGCLTKEGKKSVAQKIVLEAMEIMRTELAGSAAALEAEVAAKSLKIAEATQAKQNKIKGFKSGSG